MLVGRMSWVLVAREPGDKGKLFTHRNSWAVVLDPGRWCHRPSWSVARPHKECPELLSDPTTEPALGKVLEL